MNELDKEIDVLRDTMKKGVKHLRDLEQKPELKGFDLSPLRKEIETISPALHST